MTFRFLHLADLHLDSAYGGRAATRKRLRLATMEAFERAISFAVRSELDAVLIAGDAFDDARLGYDARALLRREIGRLRRAGISVVYATGNHDPGGAAFAAPGLRLDALAEPGGDAAPVHVALDPEPRTWTLRRAGSPIATVTACGHDTTAVATNLAATMRAPAARDVPHVAVLHTQVGSAKGADGHARYAPSSGPELERAGFAYWALGHVHVRGPADRSAPAWYSGNLQGRNPRESGPKGGLLVEVDRSGLVRQPEFVAFAPVEFVGVELDARTAGAEPEDLAAAVHTAISKDIAHRNGDQAPQEAVVRVVLTGPMQARLHAELADPTRRTAIEDAVRDDPQLAGLGIELHEIQLRAERRPGTAATDPGVGSNALERALSSAPSALGEALRLASTLEDNPSLADDWTIDWANDGTGDPQSDAGDPGAHALAARRARIATLAGGLRAEMLLRARRSTGASG